MIPDWVPILVFATAALVGLGFWLYGIHVRLVAAADARGYERRAQEGVAAGFAAGWHPGATRGAR